MNAQQMLARYREGYTASRVTSKTGKLIMIGGLIVGTLVFAWGVIYTLQDHGIANFVGIMGAMGGVGIALSAWWTGLLLSASGQLMKAQLDIAVNTSVVFSQGEKESLIAASLD